MKKKGKAFAVSPQGLAEVTWVVTDIEGSTKLWEHCSTAMKQGLEVHDYYMRTLLAEYNGYEITTEGDSLVLAFHEALDAAAFCLSVQEAFVHAPWPKALLDHPETCTVAGENNEGPSLLYRGLRIRMAMHTGTPESIMFSVSSRTIEYTGSHFATAKRICDMCRGGQVLMSGQSFHCLHGKLALLQEMLNCNSVRQELPRGEAYTALRLAHKVRTTSASPSNGQASVPSLPTVLDMGMLTPRRLERESNPEGKTRPLLDEAYGSESRLAKWGGESEGLTLFQIFSPRLMQRLPLLTSISIPADMQQRKPSFFDAPGVLRSPILTAEEFPEVTVVFCTLHGLDKLLADLDGDSCTSMMRIYREVALEALDATDGYLCQDRNGLLLAAFPSSTAAVAWAIALHASLLHAPWPTSVLAHPSAKARLSSSGAPLFRGPTPRVALMTGRVHTVAPHPATGRAEYYGPVMNTCARLFSIAGPGHTICDEQTADGIGSAADGLPAATNVAIVRRARVQLHGVPEPLTVIDLLPKELQERDGLLKAVEAPSGCKARIRDTRQETITSVRIVLPRGGFLGRLIHAHLEVSSDGK